MLSRSSAPPAICHVPLQLVDEVRLSMPVFPDRSLLLHSGVQFRQPQPGPEVYQAVPSAQSHPAESFAVWSECLPARPRNVWPLDSAAVSIVITPTFSAHQLTTSRALRLISTSRFAISSRSISRPAMRDTSDASMPCQFSLATAYCVCKVSICRSNFA